MPPALGPELAARLFEGLSRRFPGSDELTRRVGRMLGLAQGVRALDAASGTGAAARLFAREYGARVVALDADALALEAIEAAAKAQRIADRIQLSRLEGDEIPFPDLDFDAVVTEDVGRLGGVTAFLSRYGPKVRWGGGIAVAQLCRVGRQPHPELAKFFAEKRGLELQLPAVTLTTLFPAGFEPIAAEVLGFEAIAAWYTVAQENAEGALADPGASPELRAAAEDLKAEAVLVREAGKGRIAVAYLVGRKLDELGVPANFLRRSAE